MRAAGKLVAQTLALLKKAIAPGVTTKELEVLAADCITSHEGIPSFKGYRGFPGMICTSVNEEVVHGIPGLRKLKNGDIISIDVGVIVNNYQGDGAATFPVGKVSPGVQRLLEVAEEALWRGIQKAKAGNRVGDISYAIQSFVEAQGFTVVREFVGHGIGRQMHEAPQVPNFGSPGHGPRLRPGMTLAIEPMVNMGTAEVLVRDDQWTVVTKDGKYSAHFEHTVAITPAGPEILTLP